ncbi:MAG: CBS domain-containing protein [Flavobacteriales bacterium]|jgi:acetoin utilization protein AcuB|nr:CBS domain-containing protein [Flavobacteriales bacterium]MBT4881628.1 CBS domain-containing protein [Flavobacteriales bacterium]MDG1348244.1 CBS domain-containing protein [Flavobacteriales bacterium]|tara:strand:- start:1071 stop:1733 length:663 start_codon:yes stop_codon:yes gene_type:complete
MQASKLISSSLVTLHPDDDGERALSLMDELRVNHLAVVRNSFYLGILSEKEILSWNKTDEFIDEHLTELTAPSVIGSQHLFDILQTVELNNLSVIPVLDEEKHYLGAITNRKLLYTVAKSTGIQSIGGMLVLQMKENDYSMSEIARIIESNDTKILSSYITSIPDAQMLELTLKLNKVDITAIVKDFERFDYTITASYNRNNQEDDFMERYESLMRFLNP